jgi:hypothetical protein
MRPAPDLPAPNPFERLATASLRIEALTVDDRLLMVRGFNTLKCLQALRVPGLQPTVRHGIHRRLAELGIDLPALQALRGQERGR